MTCKICGAEQAEYRERSGMRLCATCHRTTPRKASREAFEAIYWAGREDVPYGTRREFWEDYRASTCGSVAEYVTQTTSEA